MVVSRLQVQISFIIRLRSIDRQRCACSAGQPLIHCSQLGYLVAQQPERCQNQMQYNIMYYYTDR